MSTLFFDQIIRTSELEMEIAGIANSPEEKEEFWALIDSILHYQVLHFVLSVLPGDDHLEFMEKFASAPYDTELLTYLNQKLNQDSQLLIDNHIGGCVRNLLDDIKGC